MINGGQFCQNRSFLVKMVKIGSFWPILAPKWHHISKFGEIGQIIFHKKFLRIISVIFMDIVLVKNVINRVNLVKLGHFWWKCSKFWHFGGQNDAIYQNLGEVVKKIFHWKFLKIISVRIMDIILVKNVINRVNLVKIGHFWCFPYIS